MVEKAKRTKKSVRMDTVKIVMNITKWMNNTIPTMLTMTMIA